MYSFGNMKTLKCLKEKKKVQHDQIWVLHIIQAALWKGIERREIKSKETRQKPMTQVPVRNVESLN